MLRETGQMIHCETAVMAYRHSFKALPQTNRLSFRVGEPGSGPPFEARVISLP